MSKPVTDILSHKAKERIRSGCTIAIVIGLFFYFLVLPFISANWPGWPKTDDPDLLIRECSTLFPDKGEVSREEQNPSPRKEVPKEQWPASIKDLDPRAVTIVGDCVVICISSGGIGAGWGFEVYPDRRSWTDSISGDLLRGVIPPGIFMYETKG